MLMFFVVGAIFFLIGQASAADTGAESAVAISCGAVFGLAAAVLAWKFPVAQRAGAALAGACAGAVVAFYANMVGLHKLDSHDPNLPFYILVGLLPVVGLVAVGIANRYVAQLPT